MKPQSTSLQIAIPQYRMHTHMFDNVLIGMTKEQAKTRIEGRTNHVIWMAGNMVNCRYWLANVLGIENKDPNEALFKDAKSLDENANYPTLETLNEEWHKISPILYRKLLAITEDELSQEVDFGMGVDFVEENKRNMVGMGLDRESYLLGQLALMRRIAMNEGMRYDMNKAIEY